jgi:signal transduction histidine kinase
VRILAQARETVAEIRFEDNGIGISPEDLPRIWERLFRGDRSRSERGLGLGLSFVRALVQAHDGTVAAESEPGRGTIIRLTLPLVLEAAAENDGRR